MSSFQKLLLVGACALIAVGLGMKWEANHSPLLPRRSSAATDAAPGGTSQDSVVLHEYRVTKPALPLPGNRPPLYPSILRSARIGGSVLVQFVVDTSGRAEMATFKEIRSSDARFTDAVRDVIPYYRFTPAEAGGRKVRQIVQLPFEFATKN